MSFEEAVLRELSLERDAEEVVKTSVYLPRWLGIATEIIHSRSNMSADKLYTGMINYGSALMQHRFGDELEAHQQVRGTLLESGDDFKAGFLYDFKSLGDVMFIKPRRRSVRIPEWCVKYLGSFSGAFPIEYSATIRLSIAYALMKNEVTNPCKENCVCETESFERGLNTYMQVIGIL